MKKLIKKFTTVALLVLFTFGLTGTANAATSVMWGKTELKVGQIGKITVLGDSKLVKIEKNGSLSTVRTMKKGEEYRVYSYKGQNGGLYGVGGGSFVQISTKVKYETPSKSKLALLKEMKEKQDIINYVNDLSMINGDYDHIVDYMEDMNFWIAEGDMSLVEYQKALNEEVIPYYNTVVRDVKKIKPSGNETREHHELSLTALDIEKKFLVDLGSADWTDTDSLEQITADFEAHQTTFDLLNKKRLQLEAKYKMYVKNSKSNSYKQR